MFLRPLSMKPSELDVRDVQMSGAFSKSNKFAGKVARPSDPIGAGNFAHFDLPPDTKGK